jgi:hypothetical protein
MSAIHEEGSREATGEAPTQENESVMQVYNRDMQEYFNMPMKHESIKPMTANHNSLTPLPKANANRPMTSVARHGSNPRPGVR